MALSPKIQSFKFSLSGKKKKKPELNNGMGVLSNNGLANWNKSVFKTK